MDYSADSRRFHPGQLVATPNVLDSVPRGEIFAALRRHLKCDWGNVSQEDKNANDWALKNGERLFSVYHSRDGVRFWIITEADRSVTTVLLPEDY